MKKNSAFTLIELSVVLAIIGLIAAGIVGGQSLTKTAKIRSLANQLGEYSTAANAFFIAYEYWPGDLPNGPTYWSSSIDDSLWATNTAVKDGDKIIDFGTGEEMRFWEHLSLSGTIPGSYTGRVATGGDSNNRYLSGVNVPTTKLGGRTIIRPGTGIDFSGWPYGRNENWLMAASIDDVVADSTLAGILSGSDARSLDIKVDDGNPSRGKILVVRDQVNATSCVNGDATAAAGSVDFNTPYETTPIACRLIYMMQ